MNGRIGILALTALGALALQACDPKTPVQTSDITTEIDQKIAAHNADATAHANLLISSGQLSDQIPTGKIADAAITAAKLANASVGSAQIAPGAVTAQSIAANAVQTAAIGDLMVTNAKIADATITGAKLSATANIAGTQLAANANIAGTQLANATVTATQIANNTITATQIANNTITATQIANATITSTQIAAAAGITGGQLAQGTVTDTNVNLAVNGTGNSTAATTFYAMNTDNAWVMNTTVTMTFSCSSTNNDGKIAVFDNNTKIGTTEVTCDGFLKKVTFSADKMKTYNLKYTAASANSPVTWRSINVTW